MSTNIRHLSVDQLLHVTGLKKTYFTTNLFSFSLGSVFSNATFLIILLFCDL